VAGIPACPAVPGFLITDYNKIKSGMLKKTLILLSALWIAASIAQAPLSSAEERQREESIRELIMRLDKDYNTVSEDLLKLDSEIKNYPATTVNVSVVKREPTVELISIELLDNEVFVTNHFYSQSEAGALDAGARHQIYSSEIGEGGHNFRVIYYWRLKAAPVQKGEAMIKLFAQPAKSYYVELSFEKFEQGIRLRPSQIELKTGKQ
jgi:hypothetical protein